MITAGIGNVGERISDTQRQSNRVDDEPSATDRLEAFPSVNTATNLPPLGTNHATFLEVAYNDEMLVRSFIKRRVCEIAEALLTDLIDAEVAILCRASRYVRSAERADRRIGLYKRHIQTEMGTLNLRVPTLELSTYPKTIIERYRDHAQTINKILADMFLRGASATRLKTIVHELWGARDMPESISTFNSDLAWKLETLRNAPLNDMSAPENIELAAFDVPSLFSTDETPAGKILTLIETRGASQRMVVGAMVSAFDNAAAWQTFSGFLAARGFHSVLAHPRIRARR